MGPTYRDRAWCSASVTGCVNETCSRYFGPQQQAEAAAWWGGEGAPVAMAPLHEDCSKVVPPKGEEAADA
jgi:hypothetical protein